MVNELWNTGTGCRIKSSQIFRLNKLETEVDIRMKALVCLFFKDLNIGYRRNKISKCFNRGRYRNPRNKVYTVLCMQSLQSHPNRFKMFTFRSIEIAQTKNEIFSHVWQFAEKTAGEQFGQATSCMKHKVPNRSSNASPLVKFQRTV